MRRDQYIPHDVSARNNSKLMRLVEEEGAAGYGIYWGLLEYLRTQNQYIGSVKLLKVVARQLRTSPVRVKKIIQEYGLFVMDGEAFYSPGLCTRMQQLDSKRAAFDEYKRKKKEAKDLKTSGSDDTVKDSIKVQVQEPVQVQATTSTEVSATEAATISTQKPTWEAWVDELNRECQWQELMAKKSRLWLQFFPLFPRIVECFKEHVCCMGKETGIQCLGDAKHYFSCYITPGSITYKRLMEELKTTQKEGADTDPYRYEDRAPDTGERSYYGCHIPADAPPRPNDHAQWNREGGRQ